MQPVLGNDSEPYIRQPLLNNGLANKHVCTATGGHDDELVFFVSRCYKQEPRVPVAETLD
jgi:hypothetical protein